MHRDYQKAYQLRLKGKSYGEIKRALGIPKSTLSSWFKNLELPPAAQKLLEEKGRVARKQLTAFNRRRTKAIQVENQKITQQALSEIHSLSKYELLLIGAALYWGEGWKSERSNKGSVEISNSDPYFIALFARFLKEVLAVPKEKLKVSILVHPKINAQSATTFWSKVTGIPRERFGVVHQTSRASKGKRPRNSLPYGTLRMRAHSRQKFFQIKGWIDGLKHQSDFK